MTRPDRDGVTLTLTERDVEKLGDSFMDQLGFIGIRFSQPRHTMQTEGIPDRRYYHTDLKIALWWEAKRPGGKQRAAQKRFQLICEAVGEFYVLGDFDALRAAVMDLRTLALHRSYDGSPESLKALKPLSEEQTG